MDLTDDEAADLQNIGRTVTPPSEVVSAVETVTRRFAQEVERILHVAAPHLSFHVSIDERFRLAVAEAILEYGLLRRTGARSFVITDKGLAAYEELERSSRS